MKTKTVYWVRWVAVIPAAFIIAMLLATVIKSVLSLTIFIWMPPHNQVESAMPQLLLSAVFMFYGALICPEHNSKGIGYVFIMCLILIGVIAFFTIFKIPFWGKQLRFHNGLIASLIAILGAFVGSTLVNAWFKKQGKIE